MAQPQQDVVVKKNVASLQRQGAISHTKLAQARQAATLKKRRLNSTQAAHVTSATVPATFTSYISQPYTYDTPTSKPTCSVCGHVKFQGEYASLHGTVNTPRHLNTCKDRHQCIMCNPEFCKVPTHLRLPGFPVPPILKRPKKTIHPQEQASI